MEQFPKRKHSRLQGYDYAQNGWYFLTICTRDRLCILSHITQTAQHEAFVQLTEIGKAAESFIKTIPGIEKYVIMPNHVHLLIRKSNGKSIASDVRSFKSLTTKKVGQTVWQDSFYDHIIRDEADYQTKWKYIDDNPAKWDDDEYRP